MPSFVANTEQLTDVVDDGNASGDNGEMMKIKTMMQLDYQCCSDDFCSFDEAAFCYGMRENSMFPPFKRMWSLTG